MSPVFHTEVTVSIGLKTKTTPEYSNGGVTEKSKIKKNHKIKYPSGPGRVPPWPGRVLPWNTLPGSGWGW